MIEQLDRLSIRTPRGHEVAFDIRDGTSDRNTILACASEDEYGLADTTWQGVALDIGAHIGGVAAMLLADNPYLRVVAVEALPANVELLRANLAPFGDRADVIFGAADHGTGSVLVAYGASETPFEAEHRFIGGGIWQDDGPKGLCVEVQAISLSSLVREHGQISLVKIDCEGCEWSFLSDPAVEYVAEIRGEYHPRRGNGPAQLRALLEPTHTATLDDEQPFGLFRAMRR